MARLSSLSPVFNQRKRRGTVSVGAAIGDIYVPPTPAAYLRFLNAFSSGSGRTLYCPRGACALA